MSKDRLGALVLVVTLAAAILLGWTLGAFDGEPSPDAYDGAQKSTNLPQDLKLMWETGQPQVAPDSTRDQNTRSATDRAINAASRVFNTIQLVGRPRSDVIALLGTQNAADDSIDNPALDSTPLGAMVYRFDSGTYGWQFKVVFNPGGKVKEVQRKWFD